MHQRFAALAMATAITLTAFPAVAAERTAPIVLAQSINRDTGTMMAPSMANPNAPTKNPKGPKNPIRNVGPGVSALSTHDCRNVGGTVVGVGDDRCGPSRQFCRMPDTNAVCIDVRD